MTALTHCDFTTEHPLGKGEVVSSILTGSTTNAYKAAVSRIWSTPESAVQYATKREHDISGRVKSVESVRDPFTGRKPMTIQEKVAAGLNELIALAMDGGMSTFEVADLLEAEIPKLRRPFQNHEDNDG